MKEVRPLGAVSTHAAAIPAAVGEDWESPYGFTPSELTPSLPPPLPSKPSFFPLTTLSCQAQTKLQQEGNLPLTPGLLHPRTGSHGKGETATEDSNPIAAPQCGPCFPAGNVIFSGMEAPRERSLTVHTPARPQPWPSPGKASQKHFSMSFLYSHRGGELVRIEIPLAPAEGKRDGEKTSHTGEGAWEC